MAFSIIQTTDGGYAVAGFTGSFSGNGDMYIVKFDSVGALQWSRTIGGASWDGASSIIQTTDGGYAVAGSTNSFGAGNGDIYIVKLNSTGALQWSRTIGGASWDGASSIIQTTEGGYAVAGSTVSFSGNEDMYIVKLNSDGSLQWTKTLGGTDLDYATSVIQTTNGSYIVAGVTEIVSQKDDYVNIIKLDTNGTPQWNKTMSVTGLTEGAASIVQTNDGGFAVAGHNFNFTYNNDMYIIKFNGGGETCGGYFSPSISSGTGGIEGNPAPTVNSPNSIVTTRSPAVSTGGILTGLCLTGIKPASNELPEEFRLYQNYPNPFNPATKIKFDIPAETFVKLIVFDNLGRETATLVNDILKPGIYETEWNASNYASGIYFLSLHAGSFIETKKLLLVK
jgi:hypothetical protein